MAKKSSVNEKQKDFRLTVSIDLSNNHLKITLLESLTQSPENGRHHGSCDRTSLVSIKHVKCFLQHYFFPQKVWMPIIRYGLTSGKKEQTMSKESESSAVGIMNFLAARWKGGGLYSREIRRNGRKKVHPKRSIIMIHSILTLNLFRRQILGLGKEEDRVRERKHIRMIKYAILGFFDIYHNFLVERIFLFLV